MVYDLLIIGGSAAGTAAAIYAVRRGLTIKMISHDFGGEVATSGEIANYPGYAHTDGIELTEKFREHLESYKVEPQTDVVVEKVAKDSNIFTVGGKKDSTAIEYHAKAVIVATGVRPRELNMPGEKEFRNKGVSYCTVCDGPLFKGKVVAIIGGGNSANEAGIMMGTIAKKVYVLTINPDMTGDAVLIENLKKLPTVTIIPNAETQEVKGNGMVKSLTYKDKVTEKLATLEVQGIFIHIGMIPNSIMLGEEVAKNKFGEVEVNELCETSVPGLFAAGDVTNHPYKQIAIAAGQGVTAALAAVDYLNRLKS